MKMLKMHVKVEFLEEVLGLAPAAEDIFRDFIASKAPDADTIEDEVAAIGADAVADKKMTVFPKEDGVPFLYDYQWKGFFKDVCGGLRRVKDSKSAKIKAYKKEIDKLVFPQPRRIPLVFDGEIGKCVRPLRASTPQGERVSLACSETVPAGTSCEFDLFLLDPGYKQVVCEWLDYGVIGGFGQWRNSGKGRFSWELLNEEMVDSFNG